MSSHDEAAVILTGNVRSDIIMLSSLLNGQQVPRPTVLRDKANEKLSLLTYISAILTIGDDSSPLAHSVHAVSGRINPTAIECLVCAQNTGQTSELTQTTAIPAPGELEEILDATNSTRGAELLKRWAQDVSVDEFHQRNYTLRDHLRDIFQILAHLRTCNRNDPAFIAFNYLIHRRAFRKLGWCIEEFLTAWGDSPFIVLQEVDFTTMETSHTVEISLASPEYEWLARYFPIQALESSEDIMIRVQYQFRIDFDNVLKWLDGFHRFFVRLRTIFPCPSRGAMNVPSSKDVEIGVNFIRLLVLIKPIIKIILSLPGAEAKLLGAETLQRAKKRAKKATGKAYNAIEDFSFPPPLSHLETKQRQEGTSVRAKDEAEDGDEDEAEDWDEDEADDLSDLVERDSASKAQTATGRMLLSMYSVAAWKVSVDYLSKRINKFFGMKLTVHFYGCSPAPKTKCDPQLKAKLDRLFPNMGLTNEQRKFAKMLNHWAKARVHAEAALMGWAFAQCEAHGPQFLTNDVAIAVSKKCCYLCWLLQEKLNQTSVLQFSLPGTHNGIFAWIPPREIPEDILFQLRDELLKVLREVDRSHSRQSYAASNDSEDDDEVPLGYLLSLKRGEGG
ncbi:hypothetical protein DFJ43DRAFT_1022703 [Lentinula guzmanii]|uniref:Uncharacterized protein n=1 Tax=Lentinula guzmanii TaxID=2804957 RepID=A0AA38JC19_9AGAR|nr:hypothetical protein DFJ43DRAFT_1022703 [Lentinula guzmanii]